MNEQEEKNASKTQATYKHDKSNYCIPAKRLFSVYNHGYAPPRWSLEMNQQQFDLHASKSLVFACVDETWNHNNSLKYIKNLVKEREPVNMGMWRKYDKKKMKLYFGYKHSAYLKYFKKYNKLAPNIGMYVYTPVEISQNKYINIHLYNAIGYAFDEEEQPDYKILISNHIIESQSNKKKIFKNQNAIHEIKKRYHDVFVKIYTCAIKLGLTNVVMSMVGANNFAFLYPGGCDAIQKQIWSPVFSTVSKYFLDNYKINTCFMGASPNKEFKNIGKFPNCILSMDNEKALYVNAWDPHSMLGNGNSQDNSLDGIIGRYTAVAVLGWSVTNKYLTQDDRFVYITK